MEAALALALWCGMAPLCPYEDGAVYLEDITRFPCHEDALRWGDAHIAWIETQRLFDLAHASFWNDWHTDALNSRQPWRELMLAREQGRGDAWRLRRLRDLYDLIGHDNYKAGRMPSVVPMKSLWRFREVR